jgi:DNA-damage-inducible protein D
MPATLLVTAWLIILLMSKNDPAGRPLADFAPTIILKAMDFATEITFHNARTHRMGTESEISQEHVTKNTAVRQTLLGRGIRPESLPVAEDVKKVERPLTSDERNALKNRYKLDGE